MVLESHIYGAQEINPSTIKWYKNGIDLTQFSSDKYTFKQESDRLLLIITNPDEHDSGKYMCNIQSGDKQIETIPHHVYAKPFQSPVEHRIQRRHSAQENRYEKQSPSVEYKQPIALESFMKNLTIEEGNRAKFICSVVGQVQSVQWFKDNVPLEVDTDRRYRTTNTDGLIGLEIKEVDPNDSGYYTCTIIGRRNSVTSSSKLTVYERYETRKKSISYDRPPIRTSLSEYIDKGILKKKLCFIYLFFFFSFF